MTITILMLIILAYSSSFPLLILITIVSVITVSSIMPNGEYVITTKHQKGKNDKYIIRSINKNAVGQYKNMDDGKSAQTE